MNVSKQILPLIAMSRRYLASSGPHKVSKQFAKLKATQKRFQIDDGVPIFLKKGLPDKLLYNGTLLLILISTAMGVETLVALVLKK